ncbi:hypothetical protein [Sediminibacterium soli]|uniref:hypothetical protein n=1 Tax=Sediminibacterium soli TaxID=2698829 RepID=UPI0037445F3E
MLPLTLAVFVLRLHIASVFKIAAGIALSSFATLSWSALPTAFMALCCCPKAYRGQQTAQQELMCVNVFHIAGFSEQLTAIRVPEIVKAEKPPGKKGRTPALTAYWRPGRR